MSLIPRWIGLVLLAATTPAVAKTKPCTQAAAATAESATDDAHKSWTILNAQYRKYAWAMDCDDGAIAEGWDDAVARLLANSWADLPTLTRLVRADPEFLPFVVRHVMATATTEDLERARANAEARCPAGGHDEICRLIAEAAATALADPACSFKGPPGGEAEARHRVEALVPGVRWASALRVSLVGRAVPDYVFLGRAQSEAVVGVVASTACDVKFVFRFKPDAGRQDGLCGDPVSSRVVEERLPSTDDADAPLAAKARSDARRRGFRLESGDCDSFHFYFDGLAVRWWRR